MKDALLEATLLLAFIGTLGLWLMNGDYSELERKQAAAEQRDRFYRGCLPRKGDIVTASWDKGELVCKRITTSPRYGKSFPHAEVRIAEIDL